MPKAVPINPDLIRAIFDYDPTTGTLTPKPTCPLVARRTDRNKWEINGHRHVLHRLVWAWHNPHDPNPYSVQFHDMDRNNTRIENLYPIPTNPRWIGHVKQIKGKFDRHGRVVLAGDTTNANTPDEGAQPALRGPTPRELRLAKLREAAATAMDTSFISELEATLADPKPPAPYRPPVPTPAVRPTHYLDEDDMYNYQ